MALMKAIVVEKFGGPSVMTVKEVPVPSVSGSQVLVKIYSAGVNPVDTYIREGAFINLPRLPYTPGKDGAGIVEAVGDKVRRVKKGDRVFMCKVNLTSYGTYGEYAVVEEKGVFLLSKKHSFHMGAAIGIPYFSAYRALIIKAEAIAGQTVLVHGASGSVGLASVQLAKSYGLTVIGTAGTEEGIVVVKENGADHVLNHKQKDYLEKVMELTDNRGVDIVLEMLADENLGKDLQILNKNACVIIVGCRGSVKIEPRLLMSNETKIIGMALLSSSDEEWQRITEQVLKGLEDGWVKPVIDKTYSLEDSWKAHRDIIESKGAKGKLIITVQSEQ